MGKQTPISTSFQLPDGREVILETGKLATQADGSVLVRMGKTMILATAVSALEAKEGQAFFPLSVDYQEKFASAGRIPGNFFKRETKLNDYEVLISRLVDRAIRPLFPEGYMNDTQIIISLISGEKDTLPDAFAALAASAAISVSNIPWSGPISEVRVARVNGEFRINPTRTELENADINLLVGATMKDVTMVEGDAKECQEHDMVEAIRLAHEAIKVQCQAQLTLASLVGESALVKREVTPVPENEIIKEKLTAFCRPKYYEICKSFSDKHTRKNAFKKTKDEFIELLKAEIDEEFVETHKDIIDRYAEKLKKQVIREMILNEGVRLDGRDTKTIRDIWSEVDYLPSTHGSALFTRGETQALTSLTLGTKLDEAMNDTALLMSFDKFLMHYNFPGFSVGEVKPQRAPARREVGHANLAGRSLKQVLPKDQVYTIRIVSDILESNGSSSMATVCAGSLALMDAGIQIPYHVAGIAMGLIAEEGRFAILSDILGDEDAIGDMDFKVTGTRNGITGCQMDIKIDGLPYEIMEKALLQAKEGRMHILGKMEETIAEPREDLKPHAPRIVEVVIDKSFIGAVIGPGGSIIQQLQADTNTVINIEEKDGKGYINIASSDKASIDAALERISKIVFVPTVGETYEAKVVTMAPYGVFLEFNGKTGLLHISEISHTRVENVEDVLKEGDMVKVKLLDLDRKTGKMKLSRKALLPNPRKTEGGEEGEGGGEEHRSRPPRQYNDRPRDNRGRDRDRHSDRPFRNPRRED